MPAIRRTARTCALTLATLGLALGVTTTSTLAPANASARADKGSDRPTAFAMSPAELKKFDAQQKARQQRAAKRIDARISTAQRTALAQRGDAYSYGSAGPNAFDCSGLVRYAFRRAGDAAAIHTGYLRSARSLYLWFRSHGKTSRTNPKIGDLVIWGRGTHVGIYVGKGRAISTLTSGVRVHYVHAVRAPFTAYLRTGMSTLPAS